VISMIGSRILSEALDRGHDVVAVVREPARLTRTDPAVRVVTGDVLEPASVTSAATGQDVVASAVGGGHGNAAGHLATAEPAVKRWTISSWERTVRARSAPRISLSRSLTRSSTRST
jgi:putative NADH-flavin reductase